MNAFHISAASLQTQQAHVDTIANNLANASTTGFKKSKVEFEDLMYMETNAARERLLDPINRDPSGLGVGIAAIEKIFSQGDAKATGRDLDFAIQGQGFFEVLLPSGDLAYSRSGHFQLDGDGMLVNADGHLLSARIQVPDDAKDVAITAEGRVMATVPGEDKPIELGYVELATFINPAGLNPLGDNLYQATEQSGDALYGEPGKETFGTIAQGFLESSNVNLIEELTNMMLAQRGYEMNAKVIQAADEMLGIANNLRG